MHIVAEFVVSVYSAPNLNTLLYIYIHYKDALGNYQKI